MHIAAAKAESMVLIRNSLYLKQSKHNLVMSKLKTNQYIDNVLVSARVISTSWISKEILFCKPYDLSECTRILKNPQKSKKNCIGCARTQYNAQEFRESLRKRLRICKEILYDTQQFQRILKITLGNFYAIQESLRNLKRIRSYVEKSILYVFNSGS